MVVHLHEDGFSCRMELCVGDFVGRGAKEEELCGRTESADNAGCMEGVLIDWEKALGRMGSILESQGDGDILRGHMGSLGRDFVYAMCQHLRILQQVSIFTCRHGSEAHLVACGPLIHSYTTHVRSRMLAAIASPTRNGC